MLLFIFIFLSQNGNVGSCSLPPSLISSGRWDYNCWQWGMLVTDCGEKLLYTYDTVVITHNSDYFAKVLFF